MSVHALLETRNIIKRFPGTVALNNVSLQFYPGEIHAIMGENGAGKSTLLNILTGSLSPTSGEVLLNGKTVHFRTPNEARLNGISIVHQEMSLFPEVTVLENVVVGITPHRFGFIDKRKIIQLANTYFKRFDIDFELDSLVKDLSVSQQQIVEIVKALLVKADVYIFDEPTATLSSKDVEHLFEIFDDLKHQGKAIVYVSHKFDEIFRISNRISILRDGQHIGTELAQNLDSATVIKMMVGRSLDQIYPEKGTVSEERIFRVTNLDAGEKCQNVSFDLHRGEILGVFGLVGSGRTEIMRALTAIDPRQSGEFELFGNSVRIRSVKDAIHHGIYYLTEDRKQQGLFLKMSIDENVAVTHLKKASRSGMVDSQYVKEVSKKVLKDLRVKASSTEQLVGSLSGGNQQKVMIGKWLTLNPKILILDEPTRGIDVGAKSEIHQLLRQLANEGFGVIVISSELPEIVGLSDRVLVIHKGQIVGNLTGSQINDEEIMSYASGLETVS
ncbi:sugar ABC transporter ATP-binding protein [Fodinisporobacter ferrooxydans]|uniref:Sugar ABC transporter ATP-binding protein n=1 Tax=Fodinisporobacter ferrooxydans TaxID=2901836 RepID=A0ABY4CKH1_9BACL|nr:sugar ABC transporter ATP-binding protein [Alicyclobacillaceae bacterium MYW30-H2]